MYIICVECPSFRLICFLMIRKISYASSARIPQKRRCVLLITFSICPINGDINSNN